MCLAESRLSGADGGQHFQVYVHYLSLELSGRQRSMYLANPTDMQTRIGYYGFNFVPSCVMDGGTIPSCSGGYAGAPACITQSMINTEYAVPSPFSVNH
jgi:hypothetical protein